MKDADGVEHTVEIGDADHLMQAAANGFVALANEPWSEVATGEIAVEIRTRHTVTAEALRAWLRRTGGAPKDITLRQRVDAILKKRRACASRDRSRR